VIIEKGQKTARAIPKQKQEPIQIKPTPKKDDTKYVAPDQKSEPEPVAKPQAPKKQPKQKWYQKIGSFFSGLFK